MLSFLRRKKGCLHGKTQDQKNAFFDSLAQFALTDEQFFREQYADLLPHEKEEFGEFVKKHTEMLLAIRTLLSVLEKLIPKK